MGSVQGYVERLHIKHLTIAECGRNRHLKIKINDDDDKTEVVVLTWRQHLLPLGQDVVILARSKHVFSVGHKKVVLVCVHVGTLQAKDNNLTRIWRSILLKT